MDLETVVKGGILSGDCDRPLIFSGGCLGAKSPDLAKIIEELDLIDERDGDDDEFVKSNSPKRCYSMDEMFDVDEFLGQIGNSLDYEATSDFSNPNPDLDYGFDFLKPGRPEDDGAIGMDDQGNVDLSVSDYGFF